jgi:hypothetical protein
MKIFSLSVLLLTGILIPHAEQLCLAQFFIKELFRGGMVKVTSS